MKTGRAVIILGMHRSGTSLLTGILRSAGLYLGDVLDGQFSLNPTGLQEPASILYMHEDLLMKNGGAWHIPPDGADGIIWEKLHTSVRDLFIESRTGRPVWGFKDPRTLLVLQGWLDVMPDAACVGIFRHPADVARSMARRNGFDMAKGFALWETYNRALIAAHDARGFPIIEFGADQERVRTGLARTVHYVDPTWICDTSLYNADYVRNTERDHDIPASAAALYCDLRERSLT